MIEKLTKRRQIIEHYPKINYIKISLKPYSSVEPSHELSLGPFRLITTTNKKLSRFQALCLLRPHKTYKYLQKAVFALLRVDILRLKV